MIPAASADSVAELPNSSGTAASKDRDIPLTMTSSRAAARCDALGSAVAGAGAAGAAVAGGVGCSAAAAGNARKSKAEAAKQARPAFQWRSKLESTDSLPGDAMLLRALEGSPIYRRERFSIGGTIESREEITRNQ